MASCSNNDKARVGAETLGVDAGARSGVVNPKSKLRGVLDVLT